MADLEGRGPLVRGEDVVQLARRDAEEAERSGSRRIEDTDISVMTWQELETVLRVASDSGHGMGLEVTIFNSALDADGSIARAILGCLAHGGFGFPLTSPGARPDGWLTDALGGESPASPTQTTVRAQTDSWLHRPGSSFLRSAEELVDQVGGTGRP